MSSTNRKSTNVSLDPELLADAKAHGVNVSRACETGLVLELKKAREARWLQENREAINSYNRWVRDNPLPLEDGVLF